MSHLAGSLLILFEAACW